MLPFLILLKSNPVRVGVFSGSFCTVDLAGVTILFFLIVSEIPFLHPISPVSINSFCCCWPSSVIELAKAWTSSLYVISVPSLINEFSNRLQLPNYVSIVFPKHIIVCRIILMEMDFVFVGTFQYFALNLL